MKKLVLGMLICSLFVLTSICLARPKPEATTDVRLTLLPFCRVDIENPIDVTVPEPGQVPENKVELSIACNYRYNVKVKWDLPGGWPKKVTTNDNISGSNLPPGIKKGKLWLGGKTTFEDLANIYKGKVTVTISAAP